ncbi:hypothetical protein EDD11_007481 [Mortierella claussenii]|nr:hypothetical protein EDD11_007481 [Mortierella claussenii]
MGSGATRNEDRPARVLPRSFAKDTFLAKTYFSETEKCYLILVTNLKQCWAEKLEIEELRERSRVSLFVELNFGLASVQWEFKLSPLLESTGSRQASLSDAAQAATSGRDLLDDGLSSRFPRFNHRANEKKRSRHFLEDSDVEEERPSEDDDDDNDDDDDDDDDDGDDDDDDDDDEDGDNATDGERAKESKAQRKSVDGMSVMLGHLILPLIALTNAYRRQARMLETVIKSKENEVVEALEMMEQNGISYQTRRKATERYDKVRAETKLQEGLEQLVRPHLFGPKELFSDKKIPMLCSIVSNNATGQNRHMSSMEGKSTLYSQEPGASSQSARGHTSAESSSARRGPAGGSQGSQNESGTSTATSGASKPARSDTAGAKTSKETEELERRRVLQEQLDKEKAEKERARKKKKLF